MDSHQTLVNYCYKSLLESIIRGIFAPGEKLQIAKLKTHLNVGPTPIREALSRLSSSGLIESEEHKGFHVKRVSEKEVKDIYSTLIKIETLALRDAIEYGDTTWEANILASLHKLSLVEKKRTPPVSYVEWSEQNYAFHYALISGCNSPCLLKIREELYQLFERYCHLSFLINVEALAVNHQDHCIIAKAVIERETEKAKKLITQHLETSREQVIERLKNSNII